MLSSFLEIKLLSKPLLDKNIHNVCVIFADKIYRCYHIYDKLV